MAAPLVLGTGGTSTGRTVETGTWANSGGKDVTFVDDMMRRIEAGLGVDTTRRYAPGFGYGAAGDSGSRTRVPAEVRRFFSRFA